MRFAYIDSQGNEVSIPSVDALALRIELGAISSETQLYDEQADYWGPAETHEIFHTLSRDKGGEGFVAPPPMAPPPMAPPPPSVTEPPPEDPPAAAEAEEPAPEPMGEEPVFLPLADDPLAPPATEAPPAPDVTLDIGTLGPTDPLPVFDVSGEFDDEDSEGADATGLGLDSPLPGSPELVASPGDDDWDTGAGDSGLPGLDAPLVDEAPMSFAGGQDLAESPPAEPSWLDEAGPQTSDAGALSDAMEIQPGKAPLAPEAGRPGGLRFDERQEPKDRPSAPRRPKEKSSLPALAGVVVVGVGGFFGWKAMSAASSRPDPTEVDLGPPPVVIPNIPAELMPTMRDLADRAMDDMVAEFRSLRNEFALQAEPNDEWLAGVYLGTASRFDDVEQYWLGIERFLDRVRETDRDVFHDKYVARVRAAGIAADTAAMLVERADSGFLAARDDRAEAYTRMDNLVNAALDLHDFLIENEQEITYDPAAGGISRDPVLEAVPSTEALGDEMWGMVDGITNALDALQMLEKVSTERLVAGLLDRIRRAGIK